MANEAEVAAEDSARVVKWANRDRWQLPDTVLAAMDLLPGMTVADLGAGDGYFTHRLAQGVGPKGRVLALDISPKFLRITGSGELTLSECESGLLQESGP